MNPTIDVSKPEGMLALQGDRVLVYASGAKGPELRHVLTLVRAVDTSSQQLLLVNRDSKTGKPEWHFTQTWCDRLRPARPNKDSARWEVTVKFKDQ